MHIQFHTPLTASEDHANSANKRLAWQPSSNGAMGLGGEKDVPFSGFDYSLSFPALQGWWQRQLEEKGMTTRMIPPPAEGYQPSALFLGVLLTRCWPAPLQ
uniref:Uncharacterized protein n=1 Tax=Coccidioides posadasii RMSCC 3488 TaxID=454284 RepID=A0A0J6FLE0_COCPO|nr:hypothetical protein CPAG_07445 [Coccidioides posadasii RMSCC 3488]